MHRVPNRRHHRRVKFERVIALVMLLIQRWLAGTDEMTTLTLHGDAEEVLGPKGSLAAEVAWPSSVVESRYPLPYQRTTGGFLQTVRMMLS